MKRFARRPFAAALFIIVVVLLLGFWGQRGAPFIRVLFSPLINVFGTLAAPRASGEDASREELARKLAVAESELAELRIANDALRALAGYEDTHGREVVLSRVIGAAHDPFRRAVFINRGAKDGVTVGAPVLAAEGVFAGTVLRVWEDTALVLLGLDQESRVPGTVVGREGALGLLEGHGVLYHLTLVPREISIEDGDVVVTGRLGTTIPPGIVIGIVSGISVSDTTPFQTIFVNPAVDKTPSYISVLIPPISLDRAPL